MILTLYVVDQCLIVKVPDETINLKEVSLLPDCCLMIDLLQYRLYLLSKLRVLRNDILIQEAFQNVNDVPVLIVSSCTPSHSRGVTNFEFPLPHEDLWHLDEEVILSHSQSLVHVVLHVLLDLRLKVVLVEYLELKHPWHTNKEPKDTQEAGPWVLHSQILDLLWKLL